MKEVVEVARKMKNEGYYLVSIVSLKEENYYEIIYFFSNENKIKEFRFLVRKEEEIPSISEVFPNARLYEWEESQKTGIKFRGGRRIW